MLKTSGITYGQKPQTCLVEWSLRPDEITYCTMIKGYCLVGELDI